MKKIKKNSKKGKILMPSQEQMRRFNNVQNVIESNTQAEVSPYLGGGLGYFGTDVDQIDRAGSLRNSTRDFEISSEEEGFVDRTWNGIKSAPGFVADTYRQLLKRIYESWQGEDEEQLLHINDQKDDLELVKRYKEMVGRYNNLKDQVDYLKNYSPNDPRITTLDQQLALLDDALLESEKYFKSPYGRQTEFLAMKKL